MNQDLEKIIEELIKLGEDADELNFWKEIYPSMNEIEQKEIFSNLKEELQSLTVS